MSYKTPILIIIFNRPHFVQQLFNEIRKQKPRFLYIACDGPRFTKEGEYELVEKSKRVFDQIDWDCDLKKFYRSTNFGAGKAIFDAINWFFNNVEEGIVFEEDCIPHQDFFQYSSDLLEKYRNNERIMFIGGNNFQKNNILEDSYYFSIYPHIWGWAAWKRSVSNYTFDIKGVDNSGFNKIMKSYKLSWNEKQVWLDKFKRIQLGQINSWDYQLLYSIWSQNGLSIIPSVNLVKNIGFGADALHCKNINSDFANLSLNPILPIIHPKHIEINNSADKYYFKKYLYKNIIQLTWRFFKRNFLTN